MAALAMALVGATPRSAAAADRVSIAELIADPARFKAKSVRLRGVVDQCSGRSCAICDEPPNSTACIRVGSWLVEGVDPEDAGLERAAAEALRRVYRFTTVEMSATFAFHSQKDEDEADRAMASAIADAARTGLEIDFVFGPKVGATWLEKARVDKIVRRWEPTKGIVSAAEDKPLLDPSYEDYQQMIKAVSLDFDIPPEPPNASIQGPRAYRVEGYDGGWVCSHDRGDYGDWPSKLGHLRPTPSASFDCLYVRKNPDGRWAVVPGDGP
jgi:hypothetical protein